MTCQQKRDKHGAPKDPSEKRRPTRGVKSKHLKGHSTPRVSNLTFLLKGHFGEPVRNMTLFLAEKVIWCNL